LTSTQRTTILTAVVLLLLAAILAPAIYFGSPWITLGPDAPAVDHVAKFNELSRQSAGLAREQDNAWPIVQAIQDDLAAADAAFGIARQPSQSKSVDYSALLADDADESERAAALDALAELERRGMWKKLDRLAANPAAALTYPPGAHLFTAELSFAGAARQAARANAYRLRTALQQGQNDEAVRALTHGLTLARVAGQQPLLIMRLVGIAIGAHTRDTLRAHIFEQRPGDATLLRMIQSLETHALPSLALTMEGERLMGQQMLYTTFNTSPLRPINRSAQMAKHNDILTIAIAYSSVPRQERDPALAAQLTAAYNLGRPYAPVALIVPALEKSMQSDDQSIADHHGTILLLAIEAHIARTGAPPESLDDLVAAGLITRIPGDPFSKDGFRYRRLPSDGAPAGESSRRGYILYSVGADGQDDGGTPAPQPHNAFTGRAPGTDYLFSPGP
jgi:hypothetical protein